MSATEKLLSAALEDTANGWSIGTFGAIAEFRRNPDESFAHAQRPGREEYVTSRGGIGVRTQRYALPVAYETLSADGETWGHTLSFCLPPASEQARRVIVCVGKDEEPLQRDPGPSLLFDLGVGSGHVSLYVRTAERALIEALRALEGQTLFGAVGAEARALLQRFSPPRIARSPLGRIEVYSAIPPPGGQSPAGPHTHLLPKLLATGRSQSANAPIPNNLQSVLTLHPPSPWRDAGGARTDFNASADEAFQTLLDRFGLAEDKAVRITVEAAVTGGADPATYAWPTTRRGRAQARIMLRRLAHRLGAALVAPWKTLYDRASASDDTTEVEPAHEG